MVDHQLIKSDEYNFHEKDKKLKVVTIYEPATKLPFSSRFPILQFAPVIKREEEVGSRLRVIQSTTEIDRKMIH